MDKEIYEELLILEKLVREYWHVPAPGETVRDEAVVSKGIKMTLDVLDVIRGEHNGTINL